MEILKGAWAAVKLVATIGFILAVLGGYLLNAWSVLQLIASSLPVEWNIEFIARVTGVIIPALGAILGWA